VALYDPNRRVQIDPADAVVVVHDFLDRCRRWAERDLPRRVEQVSAELQPEDAAKLHGWITYLRHTEHAIDELKKGELDHWFTGHADWDTDTL
jgi:hypothetical protein